MTWSHHPPIRVGLIAPPWLPVPPDGYGGTEAVIDVLSRGLQAAGCEVLLFSTGDATCPVPRSWLYPYALGTTSAPRGELAHVTRAYRLLASADIIHDHTVTGPTHPALHPRSTPVVATIHGEITPLLRHGYEAAARAHVALVAVSHDQQASAPTVPIAAVIHHGLDVRSFPFGPGDGGYVLFLGRMSPAKGVEQAIRVARAAGRPILIAAKMRAPDEHRYFTDMVEPLLGPDATYLGEVNQQEKLNLLTRAEALVNPISWPEPFGLVMIEALACGTPVLAFRLGAAGEIIEHGRTGFLCANVADMTAKLLQVGLLDRATCRASVTSHFSARRMIADHLNLYRRVLGGPATSPSHDAAHARRSSPEPVDRLD